MRSRIDECELGDDAKVLIDIARERFGFDLPVILIHEGNEPRWDDDEDSYRPDYTGDYIVDIAKLAAALDVEDLVVGNIRYVSRIIEAALMGEKTHGTSRKYSFGDTPDWWDAILTDSTEGRKVINIDVTVW